ncbi:MAG: aminotransferase class I/II-fold pyridoxal phosphate-dependent enzyme, partial [Gemmatimonadetes bacterium]|nr:aminotransferase class I/II-fold pyridoxal phosphate-dependent enzyme [Gemmatimonadota bacterium]
VVKPIYKTSTFFPAPQPEGEPRYTRYANNPNHQLLARRIAALEGAEASLVVASGNAASALTLLTLCAAGDHVVAARELYGGTLRLLNRELPRLGIATSYVPLGGDWAAAVRPNTRVLWLELPVNPTLRIPDIRPVAALAAARGIPLVVDATFATPINFRPLAWGASIALHSGTKYLGGHSDLTAGVVSGNAALIEEIRQQLISFGPVLDPHAVWLLERGVKTLDVRVTRHNENALRLATWLAAHPAVLHVHYPGLPSHPDHQLARTLLDGFGGMVSVVVRGGDEAALRVVNRLRLLCLAPSLGGVESLVSMPCFTSHSALPPAERHALGIADGFIRISVGIEAAADLIADLAQALAPEVPAAP